MALPKKWFDSSRRKRTFVKVIADLDNELVVSRYWVKSRRRWVYKCETIYDVKFQIKLTSGN